MELICNVAVLGNNPTGLGVYAEKSIRFLSTNYNVKFIGSYGDNFIGDVILKSPIDIAIGGTVRSKIKRAVWLKKIKQPEDSLIYSPIHTAINNAYNQIITIHDLICLHYPKQNYLQYLYFKNILPHIAKKCKAVFTVSEYSRHEINDIYRIPLDRIYVVPNCIDNSVLVSRKKYYGKPFLLMVAARSPHKNVDEVFDNHQCWSKKYDLHIVSCTGSYRKHLIRKAKVYGISESVYFYDYVSQEILNNLYQTTTAIIYPSLIEGFGIPPLEALVRGCRVILSDIPVHKEIFGNSCIYVTLGNRSDWEQAIYSLEYPQDPEKEQMQRDVVKKFSYKNFGISLSTSLESVEPKIAQLRR